MPVCEDLDSSEVTRECGPSCRCGVQCGNRVTQGGALTILSICGGCACYNSSCTNKSFKQGIPAFLVLSLWVALIPVSCWALEHVAKFLRCNFSCSSLYRKYLEEPCVWVESNTTTLGILSSQAEIGLGFLLVLSLLSLTTL